MLRVAIVGFGALGSALAFSLIRLKDKLQCLGRRNEHFQAVRENGLKLGITLLTPPKKINLVDAWPELGPADLVFLTIPLHQLTHGVLADLASYLERSSHPLLIPLLNGITVNTLLDDAGVKNHCYGIASFSCYIPRGQPGVVEMVSPDVKLALATHAKGAGPRQVKAAVAELKQQLYIDISFTADGPKAMWQKAAFQVPLATACCAYRCMAGELRNNARAWALVSRAAQEIVQVASSQGAKVGWASVSFLLERIKRTFIPSPAFDRMDKPTSATELPQLVEPIMALGSSPNLAELYQLALKG